MSNELQQAGTRTILSTLDEVRAQAVVVASLAQRSLAIYTRDLEPEIYDQEPFVDALKRLVLARSYARVRVLIEQPLERIPAGHRLLAMAHRLTSLMEIRRIEMGSDQSRPVYLIADDRAVLYRPHSSRWDGMAELNDPPVARLYLDGFEEQWHDCGPLQEPLRIAGR